uniref:Uncharacterized protein n=1 Tax=Zea mays TaxID=4577 RepID=B4FV60_MAIZE|nr:unknown [Zea mays]
MMHAAALRRRRRRRERERRREAVHAEAGALALAFRAHRRRPPVPRRAPHGPRQRRRQRHRGGHALPVWQAGSFALADPGQAGRAARGGLQSGQGRSGRRRRRQPVVAQALLPHVLPLRRVVHHAALHRERHLERPGPGEGDDGGPGRRPDGAPGASLQAQQQADAAEERPRRPGLPQRVHQQEDGAVAVPCAAPYAWPGPWWRRQVLWVTCQLFLVEVFVFFCTCSAAGFGALGTECSSVGLWV